MSEFRISIILDTNAGTVAGQLASVAAVAQSAGSGFKQFGDNAAGAKGAVSELGAGASQSTGFFGGLGDAVSGFAQRMGHAITTVAAFTLAREGFYAVQTAISTAVEGAIQFDQAMTQSLSIAGNVSEQTRRSLEDTARTVAVQYNTAVQDVAKGYYYLLSAGYDVASSQQMIGQEAAFAKAGMLDLATATEYTTTIQASFGLKTNDAAENLRTMKEVTDVVTRASIDSQGTIEDFAKALSGKAGAAAHAVGMSLEETAAAMEAFAEKGIRGSAANSAFTMTLRDMQNKFEKNRETWEAMGITVFDAQGRFEGFTNVIRQMETRFQGLTDEQKNQMFAQLGLQIRSGEYTKVLLGMSSAMEEWTRRNREAAGSTQEVAEKMMQSFSERMEHVKEVMVDFGITGIQKLGEGLSWLGQQFGPVFADLGDIGSKLAPIFREIGSAIGSVVGGGVVLGLEGLASVLSRVLGAVKDNDVAINALGVGAMALLVGRAAAAAQALAGLAVVQGLVSGFETFRLVLMYAGDALLALQARLFAATEATTLFEAISGAPLALSQSLGAAAMSGTLMTTAANGMRGALAGVGAVLTSTPVLVGAAAYALYGMVRGFQTSQEAADAAVKAWDQKIDTSNWEQATAGIVQMRSEAHQTYVDIHNENPFKSLATQAADWLTLGNVITTSSLDRKDKMDSEVQAAKRLEEQTFKTRDGLMAMALGVMDATGQGVNGNLDAFVNNIKRIAAANNIDLRRPFEEIQGPLQEAVNREYGFADVQHIAQQALQELGDEGASSAQKLKDFKTALDDLIGAYVSMDQMTIKYRDTLLTIAQAAMKSKDGIDLNTEASRKNRAMLDDLANQGIKMSQQQAQMNGNFLEATKTMVTTRDDVIRLAQSFGVSYDAAVKFADGIGLSESNINDLRRQAGGEPIVMHMDASDMQRELGIAKTVMDQLRIPVTTTITAEGGEAISVAQIVGRLFDTETRDRNVFIDANADHATQVGQILDAQMIYDTRWRQVFIDADAHVAQGTATDLEKLLVFVMRTRMAELLADGGQAKAEGAATGGVLDNAARPRTSSVTLVGVDQVVATAYDLDQKLNAMARPREAWITIRSRDGSDGALYSWAEKEANKRAEGGITLHQYAYGGMRENHLAEIAKPGAWRLWAEPETGGEAYIPLADQKRGRSVAILREVANMFGYEMMPYSFADSMRQGANPSVPASGSYYQWNPAMADWIAAMTTSNVSVSMPVNVSVRTDATVDRAVLQTVVENAVSPALADAMRILTTELKARR